MYGKPAWSRGKKMTPEQKKNMYGEKMARRGKQNPRYITLTECQKNIIVNNFKKTTNNNIIRLLLDNGLQISRPTLQSKFKELELK